MNKLNRYAAWSLSRYCLCFDQQEWEPQGHGEEAEEVAVGLEHGWRAEGRSWEEASGGSSHTSGRPVGGCELRKSVPSRDSFQRNVCMGVNRGGREMLTPHILVIVVIHACVFSLSARLLSRCAACLDRSFMRWQLMMRTMTRPCRLWWWQRQDPTWQPTRGDRRDQVGWS
jgi:hypothetical protein